MPTFCLSSPAGRGLKPGSVLRVAPSNVHALEHAIDALNEKLHPLRSFKRPGGTPAAAALHHKCAICRRAERVMVAVAAIEGEEVGEAALAYINRLSRLSVRRNARAANDFGMSDVLWSTRLAFGSESHDSDRRR